MPWPSFVPFRLAAAIGILAFGLRAEDPPGSRILFETGFEAFEGYALSRDLVGPDGRGQNGWTAVGYGGNGLLAESLEGFEGQYAYVGYQPPSDAGLFFNLFRPVRFAPSGGNPPVVVFQVTLGIWDAPVTNGAHDDFRWSVYTPDDHRLLTLDFHGAGEEIDFALDDNLGFRSTGFGFEYGQVYRLELVMSLGRNRWSAWINGTPVVWEQPVSTVPGKRLELGSIDAVWAANRAGTWDDNYMLFDDYRILAVPGASMPAQLELAGPTADGTARLRIWGEPGVDYRIQSSTDLVNWTERGVVRASAPDGLAEFQDPEVTATKSYRAVSVP